MMHYWRIPSTVFETWGGLLLKVEAVNFVCLVNIALLWKLSRGAYSEVRRVNFRVLVEQIQMYYWNSCRENNLLWALAWFSQKPLLPRSLLLMSNWPRLQDKYRSRGIWQRAGKKCALVTQLFRECWRAQSVSSTHFIIFSSIPLQYLLILAFTISPPVYPKDGRNAPAIAVYYFVHDR